MSSVALLGGWWVPVPREHWSSRPDSLAKVAKVWEEPWYDCRQERVFIGAGMDKAALTARRDSAVVEARDFTPDAWANLPEAVPKRGQSRVA